MVNRKDTCIVIALTRSSLKIILIIYNKAFQILILKTQIFGVKHGIRATNNKNTLIISYL